METASSLFHHSAYLPWTDFEDIHITMKDGENFPDSAIIDRSQYISICEFWEN